AAKMPAVRRDLPLPARLRIEVEHGRPGCAQIPNESRLFQLTALEQAQNAAGKARRRGPAKIVPECPLAGFADQGRTEMLTKSVAAAGFVGGVDRRQRRRWRGRESGHHGVSRFRRRCASSMMRAQLVTSWLSRRTAIRQSFKPSLGLGSA